MKSDINYMTIEQKKAFYVIWDALNVAYDLNEEIEVILNGRIYKLELFRNLNGNRAIAYEGAAIYPSIFITSDELTMLRGLYDKVFNKR